MQKYHDEPKQYKGYLKSALMVSASDKIRSVGHLIRAPAGRVQVCASNPPDLVTSVLRLGQPYVGTKLIRPEQKHQQIRIC